MANEVKITDIVGKEAIEQLEKLDKKSSPPKKLM